MVAAGIVFESAVPVEGCSPELEVFAAAVCGDCTPKMTRSMEGHNRHVL